MTVDIDPDLYEQIRELARIEHRPIKGQAMIMIEESIERRKPENRPPGDRRLHLVKSSAD